MSVNAVAHLNFHGGACRAVEFHQSVFGGELSIATYGDFGMAKNLPDAEKVVFGQVVAPSGFRIMAHDVPGEDTVAGPATTTTRVQGTTVTDERFFLSVRGETVDEVAAFWEMLAVDATASGPA